MFKAAVSSVPPRLRLRRCAAPEGAQFALWGGPAALILHSHACGGGDHAGTGAAIIDDFTARVEAGTAARGQSEA